MARPRRKKDWTNLMVQLDTRLYDELKGKADREHRTLVATLEEILTEYFSNIAENHLQNKA